MAVCKPHKQGIVKAQLQTHLDTKHQELVPRTRRNIVSAVRQNTSLQPWAMEEDDVIYPGPASTPLPHLPVYQNGLQCRECGRIYRHIKRMQEHCRQQHGWKGRNQAAAAGRPAGRHHTMWTTRVVCQKFHSTSRLGQLFQVSAATEIRQAADPDVDVSQAIEMSLT